MYKRATPQGRPIGKRNARGRDSAEKMRKKEYRGRAGARARRTDPVEGTNNHRPTRKAVMTRQTEKSSRVEGGIRVDTHLGSKGHARGLKEVQQRRGGRVEALAQGAAAAAQTGEPVRAPGRGEPRAITQDMGHRTGRDPTQAAVVELRQGGVEAPGVVASERVAHHEAGRRSGSVVGVDGATREARDRD